jgi:PAS domain S-box-containing protein
MTGRPPSVDQAFRGSIEEALLQSEERFRQVVEAAPNAIVMIDGVGHIVMVNAQTERVFGYAREEMLGQPVEMLVPERLRAAHPELRGSYFAAPATRPMGAGRDLFGQRKDGSEVAIEIGLNPIETHEGSMVLSAIVDISDRKHTEHALQKSEARFRQVVEAAPNAMVMVDQAGRIVMVNVQTERVFGYARDEMLGKPVEMLVPERLRGAHPMLRGFYFASPSTRPMGAGRDLYGQRKDGSEVAIEIGLNPIETDEGTMVLSAIVDISDRKAKEQRITSALREKEVLLGEIHHRVKNNLQIVHSLLDLQAGRVVDPAALEMLRDGQNRIRSMSLIHQVLYQSNDFASVDFANFLDSLVPTLISSYSVDPERIGLVTETSAVHLPIDCAIPCGLIVNELITNALKHAFPDGRRGQVRIALDATHDDHVILSVSDDGIGMAEAVDLEDPITLGLQLVSLLTEQIGGKLDVRRADPTRFELRFRPQDKQVKGANAWSAPALSS